MNLFIEIPRYIIRYRCYLLAQTANKDYETKVKSNNIPITKLSLISCYLENAND